MTHETEQIQFAICVRNDEADDLQLRRIYQILPDEVAVKEGYLRIIDDSGEDYLYPSNFFVNIQLPHDIEKLLMVSV